MKKLENILRKLEFGFFSFDNSIMTNENYMYYELKIDNIKYRIIRTKHQAKNNFDCFD